MDVEGEEEHIIPELADILPQKTAIFFEIHHGDKYSAKVKDCLRKNGFVVEDSRQNGGCIDAFAIRE